MQLMTWTLSRLGSRFNLLFEPYHRRVMHSAMGRFLDRPLDLMVGLVEPEGTERILPFSTRAPLLHNCEQFERLNSITFRGYAEHYRMRFEFNLHSIFYPQDEPLCLLPAFYLEMRLSPTGRLRWIESRHRTPEKVRLFIRLQRPETQIAAEAGTGSPERGYGRLDLAYTAGTRPQLDLPDMSRTADCDDWPVQVRERIVSLNEGVVASEGGQGLELDLPVTESGSGIKWRLVWGAHVGEPVLQIGTGETSTSAHFKYNELWPDIDAVMEDAIEHRDTHLARSRHLEKSIDTTNLSAAQRHLMHQSFQSFLSNAWWCRADDGREWFTTWEGSSLYHGVIDVEYNIALFYLAMWPRLLAMQLRQWNLACHSHERSGGAVLAHDLGSGSRIAGQSFPHGMPVEENASYLLMLQAYSHWTGDTTLAREQATLVESLARYLRWTDRDGSGFPSEGMANTFEDGSPAMHFARKQTYLAFKRFTALLAAADLLRIAGHKPDFAEECETEVADAVKKVEAEAWLGDHYAVCVDRSAAGVVDATTGQPLPHDEMPGWDAYSIHTGNGLLMPLMIGRPMPFDLQRLAQDVHNAFRETMSRYGCGHSSVEPETIWISQNLWRDHLGQYLGDNWPPLLSSRYWDLQVMSNTHDQSYGYTDTYISNALCFYPRGVAALGYLLAGPRLIIDRLGPDGPDISVGPDDAYPQRWPLLPLADWSLGRIPACVVDHDGRITVEGETDPVRIRNEDEKAARYTG